MMSDPAEGASLIQQAIAGDRRSTERLLLAHYAVVESRLAARIPQGLNSVLSVDDLVQDTFIEAIRCLPRCEADTPAAFAGWLKAIADHLLVDAIRKIQCQKRGGGRRRAGRAKAKSGGSWFDAVNGLSDSALTPGGLAARAEALSALRSAIDELPSDERRAVELHLLQHKSLEETADATGRSPGAIRGLVHRAKRRLRAMMQGSSRWFDKK